MIYNICDLHKPDYWTALRRKGMLRSIIALSIADVEMKTILCIYSFGSDSIVATPTHTYPPIKVVYTHTDTHTRPDLSEGEIPTAFSRTYSDDLLFLLLRVAAWWQKQGGFFFGVFFYFWVVIIVNASVIILIWDGKNVLEVCEMCWGLNICAINLSWCLNLMILGMTYINKYLYLHTHTVYSTQTIFSFTDKKLSFIYLFFIIPFSFIFSSLKI